MRLASGQHEVDVVCPPQLRMVTLPARQAELAVHAVFREYHSFVWRTLYHLGLPRDQVDDAVQETFIVVHRRLGEFDGRRSMRNWLYGIARRIASQYRRGAQRSAQRLRVLPSLTPVVGDAVDASRLEASELVRQFLQQLDDEKREVFLLAELEGLSAAEIADALGVNVNTISARLRAARQRFEKAVARHRARDRREAGA